jgi:hypothetical protein
LYRVVVGVPATPQQKRVLEKMYRNMGHVRSMAANHFSRNTVMDNMDLRLKFLEGEISEKVFEKEIQKREKRFERNAAISAVLNTYTNATRDILVDSPTLGAEAVVAQGDALVEFINEELAKIGKQYNTVYNTLNKFLPTN